MATSRVLTFTDPQQYQAGVRAMEVEVLPTARGHFRAELTHINFDRLWAQAGRENLPRVARGPVKKDRVALGFPIIRDRPGYRLNGVDASPETLTIHSVDDLHQLSYGPCEWGSLSLTPADLALAGRAISDRELSRPLVSQQSAARSADDRICIGGGGPTEYRAWLLKVEGAPYEP